MALRPPLQPIGTGRRLAAFRRATAVGFTLTELMVVVALVGILAVLAVPNMVRAKDDQRAYYSAQSIAQMFREARSRAIGTGAAQVIDFDVATGSFRWLTQRDVDGNEVGVCRQALWASTPVTSGAGIFVHHALFYGEGSAEHAIGVTTSFQSTGAVFRALCFAPSGRVFTATELGTLVAAGSLAQTSAIDVVRMVAGAQVGLVRAVVIAPSGMTRIVSRAKP